MNLPIILTSHWWADSAKGQRVAPCPGIEGYSHRALKYQEGALPYIMQHCRPGFNASPIDHMSNSAA